MKQVVVDASVAVKWVVEEDHSTKAAQLLDYDALHAPDHWQAEAVNVLWAKVFRGDLTASEADERMTVLLRAPVAATPIADLMPRAFAVSVARTVTIYHSLYIALAEKRDIPMVTADERLIRQVSADRALARRIMWIGNLAA